MTVDVESNNGADSCGGVVHLWGIASLYRKYIMVTPPITNVQLSITTAAPTPTPTPTPIPTPILMPTPMDSLTVFK
jgi:Cu/Ag efflux pump CusA